MNYLEFYSLKEQPFSNAVDNRFYYNSEQHSDALVRLKYAVETMRGLAVLVGDVGTGKTTLARRMLDELDPKVYEAALLVIIHSAITAEWLLRKITMQLGVEELANEKIELLSQLYQRLTEIHEHNKKAVVLIDEAQMLQSKEVMEEIRGILNIEGDGTKLITFILFGLPEIDKILALDEPLQQRVAMRYKLLSFQEKTTEDYIRYRLQIAGCKKELFSEEALKVIHKYSKGVPRVINTLCDNALLEGSLMKKNPIDVDIVKDIAGDFGIID